MPSDLPTTTPTMPETRTQFSPTIRRLALENFERSMDHLTDEEKAAALAILEALAPLAPPRRTIALAVAKLMTMPTDEAEQLAAQILGSATVHV